MIDLNKMNKHIWKAPWGKYIDLSKILEVSDLHDEVLTSQGINEFEITYQLLEKPIVVNHFWTPNKYHKEKSEWGEDGVMIRDGNWWDVKSWHDQLITEWDKYKSQI